MSSNVLPKDAYLGLKHADTGKPLKDHEYLLLLHERVLEMENEGLNPEDYYPREVLEISKNVYKAKHDENAKDIDLQRYVSRCIELPEQGQFKSVY